MLTSQCHFDGPPSRAHGPSAGPTEANGPPKVHGPRGHCPPCPPLGGTERWACSCSLASRSFYYKFCEAWSGLGSV